MNSRSSEAVHQPLGVLFRKAGEGAIVGIQLLADQNVAHFGTSFQAARVKQPTIVPVPYSNTQVAVLECVFDHGGDDYPNSSGAKTQPCLTPFLTSKGADS